MATQNHLEGPPEPAHLAKKDQPIEPQKELVAIARNPVEMEQAQTLLIRWADERIAEEEASLADLEENLAVAKKNKWRTSTLARQVNKVRRMAQFYVKTKAALEAGYCIVPNFPVDVFAIRTTKTGPVRKVKRNGWGDAHKQKTTSPALAEGRYVDPDPRLDDWTVKETRKDSTTYDSPRYAATEFRDVAFPFALAKRQILDATGKAMALKAFDELGVLPARHRPGCGDPMVVGRIVHRSGCSEKALSFMIAWFMTKADL